MSGGLLSLLIVEWMVPRGKRGNEPRQNFQKPNEESHDTCNNDFLDFSCEQAIEGPGSLHVDELS